MGCCKVTRFSLGLCVRCRDSFALRGFCRKTAENIVGNCNHHCRDCRWTVAIPNLLRWSLLRRGNVFCPLFYLGYPPRGSVCESSVSMLTQATTHRVVLL